MSATAAAMRAAGKRAATAARIQVSISAELCAHASDFSRCVGSDARVAGAVRRLPLARQRRLVTGPRSRRRRARVLEADQVFVELIDLASEQFVARDHLFGVFAREIESPGRSSRLRARRARSPCVPISASISARLRAFCERLRSASRSTRDGRLAAAIALRIRRRSRLRRRARWRYRACRAAVSERSAARRH